MQFDRDTIVSIVEGVLYSSQSACAPATSLSWDSRDVAAGCLFAALPGERVDGHDFIADAAASGAVGALTQRQPDEALLEQLEQAGSWLVVVDDVQEALASLAAAWRLQLSGRVIALTGSSGKTTTKNLVRDCLAAHGSVVATRANQNNELGVPVTILAADATTDYVVVEMGMRGLGQIASLCQIARPDIALVTNVGTSHIELLGSQEAIARAKAEVFAGLDASGIALLNASETHLDRLVEFGGVNARGLNTLVYDGSGADPASYGDETLHPTLFARNISFDQQGCPSFDICLVRDGAEEVVPCNLALRGAHNVQNALAASAVGVSCGMSLELIAQALATSKPEQGRQDVCQAPSGLCIIDDSYNANPDSMRASLASFAQMKVDGRRIAVLGNMGELGSFATDGHELVGKLAGASGLDALVCVGDLARGIAEAAIEAGLDASCVQCVDDARAALVALDGIRPALGPGDTVLVKASHSMGLEAVVEGLVDAQ